MEVAKRVKEQYCYVCPDMAKEFRKYDDDPQKWTKKVNGETKRGHAWECDVAYERFLGPEIFFNPEIANPDYTMPVPLVIDQTIQGSPIDCRRGLYKNIVLSGGSTMFKDFGRRLQRGAPPPHPDPPALLGPPATPLSPHTPLLPRLYTPHPAPPFAPSALPRPVHHPLSSRLDLTAGVLRCVRAQTSSARWTTGSSSRRS